MVLKMFEHERRIEKAEADKVYTLNFEPVHAFSELVKEQKYLHKMKIMNALSLATYLR